MIKETEHIETEILDADSAEEKREAVADDGLPLITVFVLCYKNTRRLWGMLDTIFSQSYPRIQLIVSDDCSDDFDVDDVYEYINQEERSNIRQITVRKNERNLGTVRHVAEVLALVEPELFVLTAADDRFVNDKALEKYQKTFASNPQALWLVSKCNVTTPDYQRSIYVTPTAEDVPFFLSGDAGKLFSRWSRRSMAVPCSMAFRREALEAVGGIDLSYSYSEDWPLVLKLCRSGFAPVFLHTIMAVHSSGGITNSNAAYGVEVRKAFFEDKRYLFESEVEPYFDLLQPEDLKAYKLYRKEIFDREYFFNILWEGSSRGKKLALAVSSPTHFLWVLEQQYMKRAGKIRRGPLLVMSQFILFLSWCFLSGRTEGFLRPLFYAFGWLDLVFALLALAIAFFSWPLDRFFRKKSEMRRKLVN